MVSKRQRTLSFEHRFEGKGLHTGTYSHITVKPSEEGTGIVFRRTDIGEDAFVPAVATNVSSTVRSTTISCGAASVSTIEHLMSALYGMGVDNALIDIDNVEVPILDGSARIYVDEFSKDPLVEQDAPRKVVTVPCEIVVRNEGSDSWIRISPAEETSYSVTVDFGSKVLGVQTSRWDESTDYASQIARCRTFVFFHEIEYLYKNNLVKGGDVENAIVIVEHPVTDEQLDNLSKLFGVPKLTVKEGGYLDNLSLRFPDECGRHKLLDMIGDLALCQGRLCAKVEAFKPGHGLNTKAAKAVLDAIFRGSCI